MTNRKDRRFYFGEARSEEDRTSRVALLTGVYLRLKYITRRELNADGLYVDEYEQQAGTVPLVARAEDGEVVGSLRLLTKVRLPAEHLQLDQSPPAGSRLELTQLVFNYDKRIMRGLIRETVRWSRTNRAELWLMAVDDRFQDKALVPDGYSFTPMGPSQVYMGSSCRPTFLLLKEGLRQLRQANHELWRFYTGATDGEPEWAWYQRLDRL